MPVEIELSLTLAAPRLAVGAAPAVRVTVRNRGNRPVWFVGVLSGSETATRFPHYLPRITRNGEIVAAPPTPEDPLVGPLRLDDFRLLQPGAAFDPTQADGGAAWLPLSTFATFRPAAPGSYEFELVVSTESASDEQWLGSFNQDEHLEAVRARIPAVPHVTVRSGIARLEVA